ncbi:hypothetical protein PlfCFBP13513_15020 [Plantibacter flavus]|uniref:hypothetical protein n=1 Tax=Plantibacter TaxID=190323 RepID=UPI0010C1EF8F|nr:MULTISPECIES: hypothetical protein [Plantibacter]MBD8103809.1 hypothetical protein [Plantibacter sp. CFBP 8775]MBD8467257.1 hypothetical protein [Plantibacter sp. CFBP 8798]TKJ96734.1 hypothetical protein PlfCFBP13513_15020 [Plantibacter flavus]
MQQPEPTTGVAYVDSPLTPAGLWAQLGTFIGILAGGILATFIAISGTIAAMVATATIAGTILMSLIR